MTPDPPKGQGPRGLVILCPGVKLRCPPVQNLNEPPAKPPSHEKITTTYLNFDTITLSTSKPWLSYSSLVCKNNKGLSQTILLSVFIQVSENNSEDKITICSLITKYAGESTLRKIKTVCHPYQKHLSYNNVFIMKLYETIATS